MLQKNTKKENDNQPDYRISFKVGDVFVQGGGAWKKTDKNGGMYLSCKLGNSYKENRGWHIEADTTINPKEALNEL